MNVSRRSFLQTGSKFGLAAMVAGRLSSIAFGQQKTPLGSGLGNPVPKEALDDPLYKITRAMFTENLNMKFGFSLGGVKLTYMVLVEVNDLNPAPYKTDGTGNRDCFSLVFRGPLSLPLEQGTYKVSHGKLGKFQLFIVPGDKTSGPVVRYGALINRLYP